MLPKDLQHLASRLRSFEQRMCRLQSSRFLSQSACVLCRLPPMNSYSPITCDTLTLRASMASSTHTHLLFQAQVGQSLTVKIGALVSTQYSINICQKIIAIGICTALWRYVLLFCSVSIFRCQKQTMRNGWSYSHWRHITVVGQNLMLQFVLVELMIMLTVMIILLATRTTIGAAFNIFWLIYVLFVIFAVTTLFTLIHALSRPDINTKLNALSIKTSMVLFGGFLKNMNWIRQI